MPMKPKRATRPYPQSTGNLALADESLGVPQQSTAEPSSHVRGVGQNKTEGAPDSDALAPAIGIIVGIELSIMLWCLIILAMY